MNQPHTHKHQSELNYIHIIWVLCLCECSKILVKYCIPFAVYRPILKHHTQTKWTYTNERTNYQLHWLKNVFLHDRFHSFLSTSTYTLMNTQLFYFVVLARTKEHVSTQRYWMDLYFIWSLNFDLWMQLQTHCTQTNNTHTQQKYKTNNIIT